MKGKTMKGKTGKLFGLLCILFSMCFVFASCQNNSIDPDEDGSGDDENKQTETVVEEAPDLPVYSEPEEISFDGYTTYYFDGDNGNDEAAGTMLRPKKSLSAIADLVKDSTGPLRILLKRGTTFSGTLMLADYYATEEQPLVISYYGDAEERPLLTGSNTDTDTAYAVVRVTQGNIRIIGLEITDPYAYQGIYVLPTSRGVVENIVIQDCYVHDVNFFWTDSRDASEVEPDDSAVDLEAVCPHYASNGTSYGRYYYRRNGGIILSNDTQKIGPTWYENVWVLDNVVERVARTGIYMATYWNNRPGVGYGYNKWVDDTDEYNDIETGLGLYQHENVAFMGNKLDVIGGDGIILGGSDNSFLEGNVCYHANYLGRSMNDGTVYYNAAIWVYSSRNVLFRYNESAYTYMRNGTKDSEGFDIDNACSYIYFDYNYCHHNEGGGLLVCNAQASLLTYNADGTVTDDEPSYLWGDWHDNYVRNNIFAFNRNSNQTNTSNSAFITVARQTDGLQAYNNIVIIDDGITSQHIIDVEDTVASYNHAYYNNIFYAVTPMTGVFDTSGMLVDMETGNNVYYNIADSTIAQFDDEPITIDGLSFVAPDDMDGYDKISSYCFTAAGVYTLGRILEKGVETDILGNATDGIAYLGAFASVVS